MNLMKIFAKPIILIPHSSGPVLIGNPSKISYIAHETKKRLLQLLKEALPCSQELRFLLGFLYFGFQIRLGAQRRITK